MVKKIVIADDEPDMLDVIEFRLKKKGYECIVAVDGRDALEKIKLHKPDVVVLDYRMPIMDGREVCRLMKQEETLKKIPVLLLTASAEMAKSFTSGISSDFAGFLIKPFKAEEFLAMVEKYAG
jgi:CheY-like chemotaxis protein